MVDGCKSLHNFLIDLFLLFLEEGWGEDGFCRVGTAHHCNVSYWIIGGLCPPYLVIMFNFGLV